jgi:hypothetical protein
MKPSPGRRYHLENHLDYLDVTDAFILTYGHRLTIKQLADYLGISCQEVSDRYDNLFFIHVACQTKIDKEYHKHCRRLLRGFPPALLVEGARKK